MMIKHWFRLLGSCVLLSACTQTIDDAAHYHNQMRSLLTQTDEIYLHYTQISHASDIQDIATLRTQHTQVIQDINHIHDTLISHGPYSQDDTYYQAVATYINQTLALMRTHESELLDLRAEVANYPDTERTPDIERSYKQKQTTIINTINDQIQTTNRTMLQAQEAFANEHHLTLSGTAIE